MKSHFISYAVGKCVDHAERHLILVVVVRRGREQRLVLIANHVVSAEYGPVEQVGRRDPDCFEKAAVPGAGSIGGGHTIAGQQQLLLVGAVPVNQIKMQRRNRRSNPDIGFDAVSGGRLEIGAAARYRDAARGQEAGWIVRLYSPNSDFRLRDRAVLEAEILLKVPIEGWGTQCIARTQGVLCGEHGDAVTRLVGGIVSQKLDAL